MVKKCANCGTEILPNKIHAYRYDDDGSGEIVKCCHNIDLEGHQDESIVDDVARAQEGIH